MIWETTLLEQQNLSIFLLTQHPYIENMFVCVLLEMHSRRAPFAL